jgi:hypothetical protein
MVEIAAEDDLAKAFSRTGRVGFWVQIAVGSISLVMAVSAFILDRRTGGGTRGALALIQYLTMGSLLVLAFTTVWSYRYMLLGERIEIGRSPSRSELRRVVWIGVVASTLGLFLSMLILLFESVQLFVYFLRVPQAGVPVVQTTAGPATWVSAGDILSLTSLILATFVEILVLALGLWLLFRTTTPSPST